jgi:glycosyltransferase involved in cell wall biosynthesis
MTTTEAPRVDICFLSSKHPPRDTRIFNKEAVSLADAGFAVAHIAPGTGRRTSEKGVEIVEYRPPKGLVDRLLQMPRLWKLARGFDAAAYHCNEVDSWFLGVLLGIVTGRKVIFDVHEVYPDEFAESRFPEGLRPAVAACVRLAIRAMLPFTDRVVLAKESARPDYPCARDKVALVQNFTPVRSGNGLARQTRRKEGDRIKAVHMGGMSRERGWPQLIDALRQPGLANVDVLLMGNFPGGDQAEFERTAEQAGLAGRFEIVEWLPFREAYSRVLECDIGLVLFQPGRQNHVCALPHKMFDYMLAELPVVVPGFAVEVARIVREADCGMLVDSSDPKDIARALRELTADERRRRELGERGRKAVLARYNWEQEARALVEMYVELLRQV